MLAAHPGSSAFRFWPPARRDCPRDCPCDAPKQRVESQCQPTRSICEVEEREGFTKKIEDVREADFRLANRRLQPLGHLTAHLQVYVTKTLTRKYNRKNPLHRRHPTYV